MISFGRQSVILRKPDLEKTAAWRASAAFVYEYCSTVIITLAEMKSEIQQLEFPQRLLYSGTRLDGILFFAIAVATVEGVIEM